MENSESKGLSTAGIDIGGNNAGRWYVEWVRSHLEIFLVAFVMAMLIRCFCIEVFKIPSGSMEPTLHGDYSDGDRILANKYILYFKKPERFDVILFKYPLNKSTNFIKRVVGLPDEEMIMHNGDIYSRPLTATGKPDEQRRFMIARKKLSSQQALWIPVFDWNNGKEDSLKDKWELLPYQERFDIRDGSASSGKSALALKDSELSYKGNIQDYYHNSFKSGRNVVPDIKLSSRFRALKGGGEIRFNINAVSGEFLVHLYPKSDQSPQNENTVEYKTGKSSDNEQMTSQSFVMNKTEIQPGKDYAIECLSFDGAIYIILDKKIVFSHNYITYLDEADDDGRFFDNKVAVETRNNEVLFWDIKVGRDIYYSDGYETDVKSIVQEDKPFTIPTGKYVIMGDNVPNSKDSRFWKARKIRLKNGKTIECDVDYFTEDREHGVYKIERKEQENRGGDMWGIAYEIKIEAVADIQDEYVKFIDIDDIFGRGILVYWPSKRIKIVH